MNNIKRKRIIILTPIILIIIIGVSISVLPWCRDIDITLSGIQFKTGDAEYTEEKTINIRGRYWRYLFKNDRFEGRIEVEGYDFTFDERMWPVKLSFDNSRDGRSSFLSYDGTANGRFLDGVTWLIFSEPDFSEILIIPYGGGGEDTIFISAPANNRAEAIDIIADLAGSWINHFK